MGGSGRLGKNWLKLCHCTVFEGQVGVSGGRGRCDPQPGPRHRSDNETALWLACLTGMSIKGRAAKNVLSLGNHHQCYRKHCYITSPRSANYLTNLILTLPGKR